MYYLQEPGWKILWFGSPMFLWQIISLREDVRRCVEDYHNEWVMWCASILPVASKAYFKLSATESGCAILLQGISGVDQGVKI